jgi:3-isopropylmalate/(R)-2-methylmalate dehydratase small subunit
MNLQNLRVRHISGDISTDDIIPARYKHMYTNPTDLAPHIFENYRPGFAETIQRGDLLVCDCVFGIGSSREQAVSSMLAKGIKVVIASEFGRIFYRNAWNLGLIAIQLQGVSFKEGENVYINLTQGTVEGAQEKFSFCPPSEFMLNILAAGGLLNYVCQQLQQGQPINEQG